MSRHGVVTEPGTIRFERMLPGPIERVWAFLTEPDKRAKWLAVGPMDLRPGGRVELRFHHGSLAAAPETTPEAFRKYENGVTNRGRVTRSDPPSLLSFTWDEGEHEPSEVTFELSPRGDEVLLVLTHRRLATGPARLNVASGWHTHLAILEAQLSGREAEGFWTTFAARQAEYAQRLDVVGPLD